MRARIVVAGACILALSIVAASPAIASPADEADELRARIEQLERQVASIKAAIPKAQPRPKPGALQTAARTQLLSYKFPAFGALGIFAYPGGGSSGGGGSVTSAGMPDPYTPTDGTWNVTGGITLSAGSRLSTGTVGFANWEDQAATYTVMQAGGAAGRVKSTVADGAAAIGFRFGVSADLANASAKLASFGDNEGTSYAEKAFIDLAGLGNFAGGITTVAEGDIATLRTSILKISTGSSTFTIRDQQANDGVIFTDAGTTIDTSFDGTVTSGGLITGSAGVSVATGQVFNTTASGNSYYTSDTQVRLRPGSTHPILLETTGTKVACAVGNRGALFYQAGAGGAADVIYVCTKAAADTYAWRDIAAPTP